MKLFRPNEKYTKIALYALATIACIILFVIVCIYSPQIFSAVFGFLADIKSLFYGILFALVLFPLKRSYERTLNAFFFKRKSHPRLVEALSIIGAYLTVAVIIFVLIFAIAPIIANEFVSFRTEMSPKFMALWDKISQFGQANTIINTIYTKAVELLNLTYLLSLIDPETVWDVAMTVIGEFYNIVIGLVFSVYLIISRKQFGNIFGKILMAVFPKKATRQITMFFNRLYTNLSEYLSIRMISSLYIACLCYAICWITRVPFYPLITLLVFIGNLIPVFGPFFVTAAVSIIMLIYKPFAAPIVLGILIGIQILDSLFIENTMLNKRLRPNMGVTILLVILGFMTFGFIGALICIPVYSTLYVEFKTRVNKALEKRIKNKNPDDDAPKNEADTVKTSETEN